MSVAYREIQTIRAKHNIKESAATLFFRVLITREWLCREKSGVESAESRAVGNEIGAEELPLRVYAAMESAANAHNLSDKYPLDIDLFYRIYCILKPLSAIEFVRYLERCFHFLREITIPDYLWSELKGFLTRREGISVLITELEKYDVSSLYEFLCAHRGSRFVLSCENSQICALYRYLCRELPHVEVVTAELYSLDFLKDRAESLFDLILSVPTFWRRNLLKERTLYCREQDLAATQILLEHLNKEGELAILLPSRITFAGAGAEKLREMINVRYGVREINILPPKILNHISVGCQILLFGGKRTDDVVVRQYKLVNVSQKKTEEFQLEIEKTKMVPRGEFEARSDWNINMAIDENDDDMRRFTASSVRKMRLDEAASLFRGRMVSPDTPEGEIGVIHIANITELGIRYEELARVELTGNWDRFLLQTGDVLVTSRGTAVKIAVFCEPGFPCIASANLSVIRPNPGEKQLLLGGYLKLFLESPVGAVFLKGIQRSTIITNINVQDLARIDVPVPALDFQKSIVERFEKDQQEYRRVREEAEARWRATYEDIQKNLF